MGRPLRPKTRHTGLGGRGVQPRGWSEHPSGPMGRQLCLRAGHTGLGGTGSPAQGVVGVSLWAHGEAASSKNRAHRPGGTGSPAQGGVRNLLQGPRGANICREPGAPAWGGRGAQPRGCSEPPARPMGGHHLRRTGRTGELGSTQGVVWCGVVWCGVVWCGAVRCGVVRCAAQWHIFLRFPETPNTPPTAQGGLDRLHQAVPTRVCPKKHPQTHRHTPKPRRTARRRRLRPAAGPCPARSPAASPRTRSSARLSRRRRDARGG